MLEPNFEKADGLGISISNDSMKILSKCNVKKEIQIRKSN